MLLDQTKEEIARDMLARAASAWGQERAEALRRSIEETAGWLALILRDPLGLVGDEPDYLIAPAPPNEAEG